MEQMYLARPTKAQPRDRFYPCYNNKISKKGEKKYLQKYLQLNKYELASPERTTRAAGREQARKELHSLTLF